MKRLLCMQDISCIGKCSMTAALPVLACIGVEAVPLPTALLSSHTAFQHVRAKSLRDEIPGILAAWQEENITFDGFLGGYLGSREEVGTALEILESPLLGEKSLKIVDPAFGDHGRLYRGMDEAFVESMKRLVGHADLIVPNLTEALFLLGEDPEKAKEEQEEGFWKELAKRLSELGPGQVVLTGFSRSAETIGALAYSREGDAWSVSESRRFAGSSHGTGDLFAAALAGAMLRGLSLQEGICLASDFVSVCFEKTLADPERRWYGTSFESALPWLCLRQQEWSNG